MCHSDASVENYFCGGSGYRTETQQLESSERGIPAAISNIHAAGYGEDFPVAEQIFVCGKYFFLWGKRIFFAGGSTARAAKRNEKANLRPKNWALRPNVVYRSCA